MIAALLSDSLDPVQTSLLLLVAAAVVLYAGVRLLWAAVPSAGLWRGAAVAVPVIVLAVQQTAGSPGTGVALLVGAGVLAMTLGLGVAMLDLPEAATPGVPAGAASPVVRTLLPLAAVVCLAGFHGELSLKIAAAIAVVGGLSLWSASGERTVVPTNAAPVAAGVPAAVLLAGGLVLLTVATSHFRSAAGNAAVTPVVVLLTVPAALLAMVGLLAAEARRHAPQTPLETVTGFTLACLGVGLPLAIAVGHGWPKAVALAGRVVPRFASTQPATQPFGGMAVLMPLATWRIDSVLLLVVAALLVPVGTGRLRLGKPEGTLLILLYLAYAAVATRAGTLAG